MLAKRQLRSESVKANFRRSPVGPACGALRQSCDGLQAGGSPTLSGVGPYIGPSVYCTVAALNLMPICHSHHPTSHPSISRAQDTHPSIRLTTDPSRRSFHSPSTIRQSKTYPDSSSCIFLPLRPADPLLNTSSCLTESGNILVRTMSKHPFGPSQLNLLFSCFFHQDTVRLDSCLGKGYAPLSPCEGMRIAD